MPIQIMIIHEGNVVRKIISDYILTELSEAVSEQFASSQEALKILQTKKYDFIFCGLEMPLMDGIALYKKASSSINAETPFIIITSSYSKEQYEHLTKQGIKHVIDIPFTSIDLRNMINTLSDPRKLRLNPRYCIPNAHVIFKLGEQAVQSDMINISISGVLCDLNLIEMPLILKRIGNMIIQFPDNYGGGIARDIVPIVLRLTAISWRKDHSIQRGRVAFKFIDVPQKSLVVLDAVFEKAQQYMVAAEEMVIKER